MLRSFLASVCTASLFLPAGAYAAPSRATRSVHHLYQVNIGVVLVDVQVTLNKFFPDKITIHAGDSIRFNNVAANAPQTITFGPLLDTPALLPKSDLVEVNPRVSKRQGGSRVTDTATIYSSGALMKGIPGLSPQVTFTFPQVGTYTYRSLFHPESLGQVVVVPPSVPASPDPPDLSSSLFDSLQSTVQAIQDLESADRNNAAALSGGQVLLGVGNKNISIETLNPAVLTTKVGSTITWVTSETSGDPHGLVFSKPTTAETNGDVPLYTGIAPDGGLIVNPAYRKPSVAALISGSTVTTATLQLAPNQRWTSGLLYNAGINYPSAAPTSYSLKFDVPGGYEFVDPFHTTMTGTLIVLP